MTQARSRRTESATDCADAADSSSAQRGRVEAIRWRLCSGPGFAPIPLEHCDRSLPSLVAEKAREHADLTAVEATDRSFTYAELASLAGGVAARLMESGEAQETVALVMDKGALPIAAMLGALAANRIFVPLDPDYPEDRFEFILKDSGARTVLVDEANQPLARERVGNAARIINVDRVTPGEATLEVDSGVNADSLAYILYTSGSTGQPKGVPQTHRNIIHFSRDQATMSGLHPGRRHSVMGSYSFAQSTSDIWPGLLTGSCLLPFDLRKRGLAEMVRWLKDARVQSLHTMPTIFRHLLDAIGEDDHFPDLEYLWLGSEPTTRADVRAVRRVFSRDCIVGVTLGATEINAARFFLLDIDSPLPTGSVPIGYGFDEVDVLILDEEYRPLPPGEIGEIAVKSRYLAPGYWNRPELTARAFRPAPEGDGARLYLTGDLGVKAEDGCVTHCGRKDFRARIRGHRVEVTEVEAALLGADTVREAAVMARGEGRQYLVAYVALQRGRSDTAAGLRSRLARTLPHYMIPSAFVFMDALPLTPNGKLDRLALPEPSRERPLPRETYLPPALPLEYELVRLWEAELGVDGIGIRDDFFELGGDSLAGATLFAAMEGVFDRELPLDLLYRASTIESLIDAMTEGAGAGAASPLVPIQPSGARRPVFFIAHLHAWMYRNLSECLGTDQPFYALRPAVPLTVSGRGFDVREMAERYVQAVRRVQPHGPYVIGGMSVTGYVALEVARQLFELGEEVALLALLDTAWEYPAFSPRFRRRYRRIRFEVMRFLKLSMREKTAALVRLARRLRHGHVLAGRMPGSHGRRRPGRNRTRLQELGTKTNDIYRRAARRYSLQPYPGRIAYFLARDAHIIYASRESRLKWQGVAQGGFEAVEVPGGHIEILTMPAAEHVARKLAEALDEIQ